MFRFSVFPLFACAALLASCSWFSSGPKAYDVRIGYDPSTIERFRVFPSVEVDVVAADEATVRLLEKTEIDDYFDPGGFIRGSLRKKTFRFSEEQHGEQVLSRKDPVWDSWIGKRRAGFLVLFVSLPRDGDKGPDLRKLTLPLDSSRWEGDEIDVSMIPAGLLLQSPLNPED